VLSDFANWATIFGSIFALLFAGIQIRASRIEAFSNRRPYIVVRYVKRRVDDSPDRVYVKLANTGKTPAYGVRLEFSKDADWHWVLKPDYPFLDSGLGVIEPGESLEFLVGTLSSNSKLNALLNSTIHGIVHYRATPSGKIAQLHDPFEVTLKDFRYRSRS
jgi:hypothetical protein